MFRPGLRSGSGASVASGPAGTGAAPPSNYIPGLGRGASGFTTRSDVGPAATNSNNNSNSTIAAAAGSGSRASESRQALRALTAAATAAGGGGGSGLFGHAPANYIAGAGRGASRLGGGADDAPTSGMLYDPFNGYYPNETAAAAAAGAAGDDYGQDDDEADRIWAAIDEKMNRKRNKKKKRTATGGDGIDDNDTERGDDDRRDAEPRVRIGAQFRELKEQLAAVTEEEWARIPDVGDYSLKYSKKQRQQATAEVFTPLTDQLLDQRHQRNRDATAGHIALPGTTSVSANNGFQSVVAGMSGLSAARGAVLGMSLDRMSSDNPSALSAGGTGASSVPGSAVPGGARSTSSHAVDPDGYLTSLASMMPTTSAAEVADLNKARLLLKSVRDTNPHHGPGWIASARVEEAAGKLLQARKLMQEACQMCPDNPDVWLEAARLHPIAVAKSILATAVRRIPTSVQIFLKAADLEATDAAKKAVLRKGLEANPTSVTLWKAAIELEEVEDACILLSVAVEKVPHSVEMWLALARLESYENAQRVLNKARKALPTERIIWIAAAKLEESQQHDENVDKVIGRAISSLAKHDAVVSRAQWLQEAEAAEAAGAPVTSAAIIKHTVGMHVEAEDQQRTWSEDAKSALGRGSVATARAILAHALAEFPTKRTFWIQAVELERKHGTAAALDEVLAAASARLPRVEIFWLLRAKERWLAGQVDKAREILTQAFAANPDSEAVWLAAAKLEWENGEIERARVLFQRARERAPTERVYMKSALLEREQMNHVESLKLIEEGIELYPKFPKLYMMGGQVCSEDLPKGKSTLARARKFFQRGLKECPDNAVLWILASRLEEEAPAFELTAATPDGAGSTKARSLLEIARLKNPKVPALWLEAIRLERRAGNPKLADALMARALQECPNSGMLLAEHIRTSPRVEQKSRSTQAIQRCPEDPYVIAAVASLFASERNKHEKARKWFDRAVILDPDLGDSWARYYAFECTSGNADQQYGVKERCIAGEPKHGEIWTSIRKDMAHRNKSIGEVLELAAQAVIALSSSSSFSSVSQSTGNSKGGGTALTKGNAQSESALDLAGSATTATASVSSNGSKPATDQVTG